MPTPRGARALLGAAVALTLAGSGLATADDALPPPATAAAPGIVLAGTFQSELACQQDWSATSPQTTLTATGEGSYTGEFEISAGKHAFKVAGGGGWESCHGVE